jgi:hypothetical protein
MGRKLYVGNLPYEAGESELQELFGQAGAVDSVRVMRDMAEQFLEFRLTSLVWQVSDVQLSTHAPGSLSR